MVHLDEDLSPTHSVSPLSLSTHSFALDSDLIGISLFYLDPIRSGLDLFVFSWFGRIGTSYHRSVISIADLASV